MTMEDSEFFPPCTFAILSGVQRQAESGSRYSELILTLLQLYDTLNSVFKATRKFKLQTNRSHESSSCNESETTYDDISFRTIPASGALLVCLLRVELWRADRYVLIRIPGFEFSTNKRLDMVWQATFGIFTQD